MSNPDSTIRTAIWIRDTYLKMETLSDVLFRVVEGYLSVALFDTARFYAERLLCCCCNDISTQIERKYSYNASLHQLALCYFRLGKFQQTYLILLDQCSSASTLPASPFAQKYKYSLEDNKYLFALACFGLDKLIEAEKVLLTVSFTDLAASKRLLASSILHLLGKICRRQHRRDVAIKYFTDSLKLDPFLWSSITELSELGVDIDLAGLIGSGQKVAPIAATFQKTSKLQNMEVVETLSSGVSSSIDFEKTVNVTGGKYVLTQTANAMQLPAGRASMSLGLSSLSLRVPFSSPFGGMPSPIHSVDTGFSRAAADPAPYTVDRSLSTDLNQSHSYVDQGQASATSDLTYSNLNLSSGVGVDPRTTLFGLPTPADNSISLSVSTPPRRTAGESGDQPDPLSLGHSGLTQDLLVTRLSVPATGRDTASISGVRQRLNPPSTSQSSRVPHSGSSTGGPQAYSRPSGRTEGQGGGRRVSFGPTARLSFGLGQNTDRSQFPLSPSGVGGIGAVTGLGGMGGTGAAASISSSGSSSIDLNFPGLSSSSSSSSEGTVGGEQKAILREEDEHPFKLQRKGSATAKGGHFGGDSSEPNLSPKSNSQSKQPSSSPFPVESSPVLHPVDATTYSNSAAHSPPRSLRGVDTARIMTDKSLPAAGPASASSAADSKKPFQQKQRQASTATSSAGLPSSSSQAKEGSDSVSSSELGLVQIVGIFARAYQLLCAYRCRECVTVLHELPLTHFRSALVSQLIGKAYYEMNEYKPAVLALREMLKLEPFRLQGLDTLSTALWHLKKDKELCALAQQVSEVDKFCPETWCVIGNCFSLQKEPDTAIRFFQRALQIDPSYTYAHTLCGHEQVNNEDMEKAVTSFRAAILCNDRHYNAWYGLGTIYFRQERFELSEYHFRRAIKINPSSSVLHCYLAMTLHAQGSSIKTSEALDILQKACERDPKNPQLRFQLAHILVSVEDLEGALKALLLVKEIAPKEPPVHALLGQVYHRLGPKYITYCLRHLNIAMDLDPKEASSLKAILERIDEPTQ